MRHLTPFTYILWIVCPLFIVLTVVNARLGGLPDVYVITLSNLAIVPANCRALSECIRNQSADTLMEFVIGTLLMCFSATYHLYDQHPYFNSIETTSYRLLQTLDFVFSYIIILTTTLFFAELRPFLKVKLPVSVALYSALAFFVIHDIFNPISIVIAVGSGCVVILMRFVVLAKPGAFQEMSGSIHWWWFLAMLLCIAIGWSGQNIITNDTLPYWFRHGLIWHVFIMFVPYCAYMSKRTPQGNAPFSFPHFKGSARSK